MTKMTDTPNAAQVLARLGDPIYAVGRAQNIQIVAASWCPTECEIAQ
jgi:hypothetical protein